MVLSAIEPKQYLYHLLATCTLPCKCDVQCADSKAERLSSSLSDAHPRPLTVLRLVVVDLDAPRHTREPTRAPLRSGACDTCISHRKRGRRGRITTRSTNSHRALWGPRPLHKQMIDRYQSKVTLLGAVNGCREVQG